MISSEAMRPGDIVRASNGKTIEIINTDAEGRLALADALCYAESLHVDAIIDVATLTGNYSRAKHQVSQSNFYRIGTPGACIVGLGEHVAGLYSNDVTLRKGLETSSSNTNELVWHLPLEKSYLKSIKSNIADLKNLASAKGGGSITAALYLQQFVKSTPWAHLGRKLIATYLTILSHLQKRFILIDIAGPTWDYASNKPTGFGVKLLVDFVLNANNHLNK
jgi:leucyl aminopeptidase